MNSFIENVNKGLAVVDVLICRPKKEDRGLHENLIGIIEDVIFEILETYPIGYTSQLDEAVIQLYMADREDYHGLKNRFLWLANCYLRRDKQKEKETESGYFERDIFGF